MSTNSSFIIVGMTFQRHLGQKKKNKRFTSPQLLANLLLKPMVPKKWPKHIPMSSSCWPLFTIQSRNSTKHFQWINAINTINIVTSSKLNQQKHNMSSKSTELKWYHKPPTIHHWPSRKMGTAARRTRLASAALTIRWYSSNSAVTCGMG